MARRHRRNAPLTATERSALESILFSHKSNPRRRHVRRAKRAKRKLTKAQRRLISLRNLRKARRARKGIKFRSVRSHRALKRWAGGQIGKHTTGPRGYVVVRKFGIRRHRGKKVKLPGLAWSGRKGTVAFRGDHHDPDFYAGSYEEFPVMFTNPKSTFTRRGKRYVRITNRKGRKVAEFRIKRHAKRRVPARLRKYLFKAGSARLKHALIKARRGWRAWRLRQLAKRRAAKRPVRRVRKARRTVRRARLVVRRVRRARRHVRRARRVIHRRKRFVFTAARRRALAKARRARR
jgi:hypothetical protein